MKILAYTYLYITFILAVFFFGYFLEVLRPNGLVQVLIVSFLILSAYRHINHRFICRVINTRILIIIETLLTVSLLTIFVCYNVIWNKQGSLYP